MSLFMFIYKESQYGQVDESLHAVIDYFSYSYDECQWPMSALCFFLKR